MIDTLKMIGISAVVVIVGLLLTGNFGSAPGVGGTYEITKQYFSQGISVTNGVATDDVTASDDLTVTDDVTLGSSAATTSVSFGKTCWTVITSTGSTTYVSFVGTGTTVRIATSTASCN